MKKDGLANPPDAPQWTRPDDYVAAMARRRTARQGRERGNGPRTEPEAPRFVLSTLPFIALIAALALLTVAIVVAAWPGKQPQSKQRQVASQEQGTAPKGWFQEAEKEFH